MSEIETMQSVATKINAGVAIGQFKFIEEGLASIALSEYIPKDVHMAIRERLEGIIKEVHEMRNYVTMRMLTEERK